jgi:hypothetical protein
MPPTFPSLVALALLTSACHGSHAGSRQGDAGEDGAARVSDAGAAHTQRDGGREDAGDRAQEQADAGASHPHDDGGPGEADRSVGANRTVSLPPEDGNLDYQLGGAYAPPAGVTIVSRDRAEAPAPGLYNICYVNGFQAQPDEVDFWLSKHPDLILRNASAAPIVDPDWDEMLLDVGTPEKRARLLEIEGAWIDGCARAGFDAVEVDNLDSYTRSAGRLREDDAIAFLASLAQRAHAQGLAIAQKNSSELAKQRARLGADFAVAEECSRYDECDTYISAYGRQVLMIEYRRGDFNEGCSKYAGSSIVLRDVNLVPRGSGGYVFEDC